jgi:hypothetical protein
VTRLEIKRESDTKGSSRREQGRSGPSQSGHVQRGWALIEQGDEGDCVELDMWLDFGRGDCRLLLLLCFAAGRSGLVERRLPGAMVAGGLFLRGSMNAGRCTDEECQKTKQCGECVNALLHC